jgi:hypothetical protein
VPTAATSRPTTPIAAASRPERSDDDRDPGEMSRTLFDRAEAQLKEAEGSLKSARRS